MRSRSRLLAATVFVAIGCVASPAARAAPVTTMLDFHSSITASITGPIPLRAELNYDDARAGAPIAVVMAGYSPTNGNLDAVRPHAQRLRAAGFFSVSVAMRGRDGSAGVRDSGGLEIHDIWDAVEAVKAQYAGFVDPTNVHITGYSGGGGNVMSAIVRFPDYFRVGASFFGMSDYGFDPVDGWYNNGAGSRTSILDQDVGNPNTGGPAVLDRYQARASNLAASNSRYVEVHLFVNDNETICPLVNHATFAANGGSHVTHHVGLSASPTYQDFNGNGVEDPGEQQLWPHGFPTADQQNAAEQWYRDRLLAGQIPEPEIDPVGSFHVPGFLRTRHFEVWPGDGQDAAGIVDYVLGETSASFVPTIVSGDPGTPIDLVVHTGFMKPAGATVEARRNGVLVDTFLAGERRVYYDLASGDTIDLVTAAPPLPIGAGPIGSLFLYGAPIVVAGLRRLR
jgi:hypothetical protein